MNLPTSQKQYVDFLEYCRQHGYALRPDRVIDHFWNGWFVHYELSRLVDILTEMHENRACS